MNSDLTIVYVAYNRPEHLRKSIESTFFLKKWFNLSYIFFIDGPKSMSDIENVDRCYNCIKSILQPSKIIKSNVNLGLKKNIHRSFSYIINYRIEKCLFLEDDIILNSNLIDKRLMNNIYQLPIFSFHNGFQFQSEDLFIIHDFNFSCWGWFLNYKILYGYKQFHKRNIFFKLYNSIKFDLHYSNFTFVQMLKNLLLLRSSWACFFSAYLFSINQKCSFPSKHLVNNIGFDGTGSSSLFKSSIPIVSLNDSIEFRDFAYKYNLSRTSKIRNFIYKILLLIF